ncbi:helix-hairpin-helix domain-containing protein [candidate division KSB1 bacterium]|nr:helix-hairpin-helix domain-containing protein [candidate division KSB1 bacterium]
MLGFTKQEQGIVLFLIFSLLVGASVQLYDRFYDKASTIKINQEFVDEFNAKSEKINSQPRLEPDPPLKKDEVIRENGALASKEAQVKKKTNVQSIPEDNTNEFALIDINFAGEEELQLIPRIGPVLAQRIIQYRQENGRFGRLEELKQVKGIGKATFKKIIPYISINKMDLIQSN